MKQSLIIIIINEYLNLKKTVGEDGIISPSGFESLRERVFLKLREEVRSPKKNRTD